MHDVILYLIQVLTSIIPAPARVPFELIKHLPPTVPTLITPCVLHRDVFDNAHVLWAGQAAKLGTLSYMVGSLCVSWPSS